MNGEKAHRHLKLQGPCGHDATFYDRRTHEARCNECGAEMQLWEVLERLMDHAIGTGSGAVVVDRVFPECPCAPLRAMMGQEPQARERGPNSA